MKKWNFLILTLSLLSLSLNIVAIEEEFLTEISQSIVINKPIDEVYDHVKDTMNDDTWRNEVREMTADGPFAIGTTYTEVAHIGLNRNFVTKTILVDLRKNQRAFYITPTDAPYFLSSLREVKKLKSDEIDEKNQQSTEFTYTVKFDSRMSKENLGVNLSPRILEISYGIIMKKYLRNLKRYLE